MARYVSTADTLCYMLANGDNETVSKGEAISDDVHPACLKSMLRMKQVTLAGEPVGLFDRVKDALK